MFVFQNKMGPCHVRESQVISSETIEKEDCYSESAFALATSSHRHNVIYFQQTMQL